MLKRKRWHYPGEKYEFHGKVDLYSWQIWNTDDGMITAPEKKEGYLRFSGRPRSKYAAVIVPVKDEDWDKYSLVTVDVCPLIDDMERTDFLAAFRQGKKWYRARMEKPWQELVYKKKLGKGEWTALSFDISETVRNKPDILRLYFNITNRFTGKVIECELGKIIFMLSPNHDS